MGNVYRLKWTKTTPFCALGRLGWWRISWDVKRRAYVIERDASVITTANTINEGKKWVEHTDIGNKLCTCCHGTGWVSGPGK